MPGALWSRRVLEENRVASAPELARVIVAVDPPATSGETANECGIVVVGVDEAGRAFVLDDWSQQASPDEWARKVVAAYRLHEADGIVAEVNQGGEMVVSVIRSVLGGRAGENGAGDARQVRSGRAGVGAATSRAG